MTLRERYRLSAFVNAVVKIAREHDPGPTGATTHTDGTTHRDACADVIERRIRALARKRFKL